MLDDSATPQTRNYAMDDTRDMLVEFKETRSDFAGEGDYVQTLTLDSATALRASEVRNGNTYNFSMKATGSESYHNRNKASGAYSLDFNTGWNNSGDTQILDEHLGDGVNEVMSITYGARGDVTAYTTPGGTWNQLRDDKMQRWKEDGPSTYDVFSRYGLSGELLSRFRFDTTGSVNKGHDEYVYLAGVPIGVTHTDSVNTTATTYFLGPDRMGIPRRVMNTAITTQSNRMIMNPWGRGALKVAAGPSDGRPELPFRYPGQLKNEGTPLLVDNRWRSYIPDLGMYTSPDPDHRLSAELFPGPQAYAYANGRPLVWRDPLGRHVLATYSVQGELLEVVDTSNGNSASGGFFSGGMRTTQDGVTRVGQPIPDGQYDILENDTHTDWYRLEPRDSPYGDDEHEATGRKNFRLHPGRISDGCVTSSTMDAWKAINGVISATSTDYVYVRDRNWVPSACGIENRKKRYGTMKVIP